MAQREIIKKGDDRLRKKCHAVTNFNERLWALLDDMDETMRTANGVGIAAPQVGILRRVAIVDVGEGKYELINPVITKTEGEQEGSEGCLSVPGDYGIVRRPEKLTVEAFDRTGKAFMLEAEGYLAVAICHEVDHLDGVLFIDKVIRMLDPDELEDDDEED